MENTNWKCPVGAPPLHVDRRLASEGQAGGRDKAGEAPTGWELAERHPERVFRMVFSVCELSPLLQLSMTSSRTVH